MSKSNHTTPDAKAVPRPIITLSVLTGLLVLLIAAIVVLAAVPPVSRDALTHHLAVPKLHLQHGGIHEIPTITFSYYPMNLDLLYLVPLYFGNDIIPKYIHFLFALLTAGLLFRHLNKRLGQVWALLGALIFLSLPIVVKLSITVYVDLGLIFFSAAALLLLIDWIESGFSLKFLVLAAVCCGLALGVKYNGLIVLFLLSVFVPYTYIISSKKTGPQQMPTSGERLLKHQINALGYGFVFFMLALLVFSPWMIRNYVWKGNPIFPLYHSYFKASDNRPNNLPNEDDSERAIRQDVEIQKKTSAHWGPLAIRKVLYQESWWEIALVPIRIFIQGQDNNPKYFDGKLNPFLLLLSILAFVPLRSESAAFKTEKKILAVFVILFILYAYLQIDMRIRYIAPIIPPVVILTIYGFHRLTETFTRRWNHAAPWLAQGIVLILATLMLTYNGIYIFQQFKHVKPFSYLSGQTSRSEYIARYRPEYAVISYINDNLPQSSKVIALFLGNRGYYFNREVIFGDGVFKKIVKHGDSAGIIRDRLRQKRLTHLMIRYDLFNRWAESQFDHEEKAMMKEFFAEHVRLLSNQAGYGVYELINR